MVLCIYIIYSHEQKYNSSENGIQNKRQRRKIRVKPTKVQKRGENLTDANWAYARESGQWVAKLSVRYFRGNKWTKVSENKETWNEQLSSLQLNFIRITWQEKNWNTSLHICIKKCWWFRKPHNFLVLLNARFPFLQFAIWSKNPVVSRVRAYVPITLVFERLLWALL